jgi:hypothetical protein
LFDAAVGPVVGPVHAALMLVAVATAAWAVATALAQLPPEPDADAGDAATLLAGAVGLLAVELAAAVVGADAEPDAVADEDVVEACVLDDEQPARTPITAVLTATVRSAPGRSRLIEVLLLLRLKGSLCGCSRLKEVADERLTHQTWDGPRRLTKDLRPMARRFDMH